jgi:predicted Zn-dependent protease
MRSWPAASTANDPAEYVELPDARGSAVATVPRELVRQILQVQERLQQPSGFSGELFIVTGKGPNAFAASVRGRRIIAITVPMLDLLGDDIDAYAALLGHEIAHHTRQHSVERRSREQSLAGVGAIAALILGAAGVRGGGLIADLGTAAVSSSYSREDEREADRLGVQWMVAAGFDPEGALRLHERFLRLGRGGAMPFLQSHPAGAERLESIRLQIAQLAPSSNTAANEIQIDPGGKEAFARGMAAYSKYDYETAHREFLQAASAGHPDAESGLGLLYSGRQGMARDYAVAAKEPEAGKPAESIAGEPRD